MSDANIVPERWNPTDVWIREPAPPPGKHLEALEGERKPDRVLYGPRGQVIARIEDRPLLGFHRDNGRQR